MRRALTEKQRAFCREYLKDFNASAAYRRAGYSPKTANVCSCQLLAKPNVQDYLAKLMRKVVDMDKEQIKKIVLEGLLKAHEINGAEVEGFQVNPQADLKALELLGKSVAMFTDRVEEDKNATYRVITSVEGGPDGSTNH